MRLGWSSTSPCPIVYMFPSSGVASSKFCGSRYVLPLRAVFKSIPDGAAPGTAGTGYWLSTKSVGAPEPVCAGDPKSDVRGPARKSFRPDGGGATGSVGGSGASGSAPAAAADAIAAPTANTPATAKFAAMPMTTVLLFRLVMSGFLTTSECLRDAVVGDDVVGVRSGTGQHRVRPQR